MLDLPLIFAVVGVFACVAVVVGALTSSVLEKQSATRRRFEEMLQGPSARVVSTASTLLNDAGRTQLVQKAAKFLPKSPKEMSRIQRRLTTAGFRSRHAIIVYMVAEIVLAVIGFVGPIYGMGMTKGLLFGILAAIVGYMMPTFVVARRIKLRQKQIENGLPDALDLLIVCLEAGLGIDQAIVKCSDELEIAYPMLAEELRLINVECRAGKPRIEAFKNFAARTKVDDVRALVSMLVQTDRFGTSVAQALRTHADVSRTKRRQRAEERAAKVGVKLVFPLVFCLFPAFYVVTLGPAVVKFVHAFGPGGSMTGVGAP